MSVFEGKLEEFDEVNEIWTDEAKRQEEYNNEIKKLSRLKSIIPNPTTFDDYVNKSVENLNSKGIIVSKTEVLKDLRSSLVEQKQMDDIISRIAASQNNQTSGGMKM